VIEGEIEAGRRYVEKDFNKVIEIRVREEHRVSCSWSRSSLTTKPWSFAPRRCTRWPWRDLVNQMKASKDPDYCHRVTANDGELGNGYLRAFQNNEKAIPTILTTSQKLSTGWTRATSATSCSCGRSTR